jgi:hypothetical protein
MYRDERIALEPDAARTGENVRIKYHGLLKNSGANEVYLYYGKDGWHNTNTIRMHMENDDFVAEVKAEADHELNFCFKDSADNWDNNNGYDWKVHVYRH